MSYARFSEGDVYVFPTGDGIECCACSLEPGQWGHWLATGDSHREQVTKMLTHLARHQLAGDVVPVRAITQLEAEFQTGVME